MAPPTSPPLDPVSLLAAVLAGILAPQTGHQAAAYVVIAASAMLGALWALSRRDPPDGAGQAPRRRLPGWVYVPLVTGSTTLVAAGASEIIAAWTDVSVLWLVAPVSLGIAAVGHDWMTVHRWMPDFLGRVLDLVQAFRGARQGGRK